MRKKMEVCTTNRANTIRVRCQLVDHKKKSISPPFFFFAQVEYVCTRIGLYEYSFGCNYIDFVGKPHRSSIDKLVARHGSTTIRVIAAWRPRCVVLA